MKGDGLDNLSDNDILARRADVMREVTKIRIQVATQQQEDTSKVGRLRKDLARLNTELRAREIKQGLAKGMLTGRASVMVEGDDEVPGDDSVKGKKSRFGLGFFKDAVCGKRSE